MTALILDWVAAAEAGGKGWQLGRLARFGVPVPPGFVIAAAASIQRQPGDPLPASLIQLLGGRQAEISVSLPTPGQRWARGLHMLRYLRRSSRVRRNADAALRLARQRAADWLIAELPADNCMPASRWTWMETGVLCGGYDFLKRLVELNGMGAPHPISSPQSKFFSHGLVQSIHGGGVLERFLLPSTST